MKEVLKQAYQLLLTEPHAPAVCDQLEVILRQAIAELESQEPVAWVVEDVCKGQLIDGKTRKIWWECEKGVGTAFYTHPPQRTEQEPQIAFNAEVVGYVAPQRTWVDLTEEELEILFFESKDAVELCEAIQAKLKDKNT